MLGVFDSGFGGLPVLRAIRDALPDLAITYLGDNARTPYGDRSRESVTEFTKECCTVLFERGCSLIILACNTASADTLRELQQNWLPTLGHRTLDVGQRNKIPSPKSSHRDLRQVPSPKNILGVVRPLAEEAVLRTKTGRIAVVGTRSTVASGAYVHELTHLRPDVTVMQQACPLLVPLVEEGWEQKPEARKILRTYLRPVKAANPDVLILGCTHYEILYPVFRKMMGRRCMVLHSPTVVARKLGEYLVAHPEYDGTIPRTGEVVFLTTGDPERFAQLGSRFYGRRIAKVAHVRL